MREKHLFILYNAGHFDAIIHVKAFLGKDHFCNFCNVGWNKTGTHKCDQVCISCRRTNCLNEKPIYTCKCKVQAFNIECKRIHLEKVCYETNKCKKCGYFKAKKHVCLDEKWCFNCKKAVNRDDHRCFILTEQEKAKKKIKGKGYIIFDYESMLEKVESGKDIHIPGKLKYYKIKKLI